MSKVDIPPLPGEVDLRAIAEGIEWLHKTAHDIADGRVGDGQFSPDFALIASAPTAFEHVAIILKNLNDRITSLENRLSGGYKGDHS